MATAGIRINREKSEMATSSVNLQGVSFTDFTQDANLSRAPDYYIYIFNISPNTYTVRRPPSWPLITIKGCPPGERYAQALRLPNIIQEVYTDANLTTQAKGKRAERWATDILNPSNLGEDIWAEASSWTDSGSQDLTRRGCFWSMNQVPTDDELAKAKQRMEKHFRGLLQQANELVRTGHERELNQAHHEAADYFRVRAPWHTVAELPEFCDNCGEEIKANAAYHMNSLGKICVRDWKRTVEAGVKARADVPVEKRWWKENS